MDVILATVFVRSVVVVVPSVVVVVAVPSVVVVVVVGPSVAV